jgi:molecular chaperone GrpE (heat shock protein)
MMSVHDQAPAPGVATRDDSAGHSNLHTTARDSGQPADHPDRGNAYSNDPASSPVPPSNPDTDTLQPLAEPSSPTTTSSATNTPEDAPNAGDHVDSSDSSVAALAAALIARIDRLGARIEARLADAVIQREGFDRLYDDFDRCRKQESLALILPWINGLIRLHDNIGKTRDALDPADPPAPGGELLQRHLAGIQDEVEVLLENNGVTLYRETDERFNARRQSVIALEPTTQQEQDGRIASRVRPGFELGERLLRKERVCVYKHRPESS